MAAEGKISIMAGRRSSGRGGPILFLQNMTNFVFGAAFVIGALQDAMEDSVSFILENV